MSYRNPTYYGIVEDMGAFTDAFQSTFGEIKKSIDANIAAKKERNNSISLARAKGIEKINEEAENVPLKLMDDYKNYFNNRLEAMGDYDTLDPVLQAKFFGDIENMARFAGEIGNISDNLEAYDGIPEDMKTAVRKWGLNQLKSSVSEKGIMIGDYSVSTIVNAFANADKLSGNKDTAAAIKEDISKNALKKLEAAQQKAGRDLKPEEIEGVIKQHVSDSAELVKNPDNDFVWKYVMDDEDKNLKKLAMPVGVSEDINMSSLNYNLSDLQKFDEKVLKTGENLRDMLVANYYTKSLSSSLGSQLKPYKQKEISDYDRKKLDAVDTIKFYQNKLSNVYKPNFKTPPMVKDFPFQIPADINTAAITTEKGRKQLELIQLGNSLEKELNANVVYVRDDNDMITGFDAEVPELKNEVRFKLDTSPDAINMKLNALVGDPFGEYEIK